VTDIWIGLAGGVPIEASGDDIGGAFAHVLAPADDEAELRAAAAEALAEHGLRLTELDESEPVRERLRSGRLAPELMELAIDAALEGTAQIGDLYSYPTEDHEDSDSPDLHALLESRTLVNLRDAAEYHDTIGYVVAIGAQWALIQIVDAHGAADGFRAVKLGTLDEAEPIDAENSFLPRLLTARPLPVRAPAVGLDDTPHPLQGAQGLGALIYLVTEDMEPGAFWIGQIAALDEDGVLLEKVSAIGTWAGSEHFRYDAITRVGFGGDYEDALAAAVGAVTGG
jgi:hypothetical protein